MLRSREDLNNIRRVYAKTLESQKTKILVCAGTGCVASGTLEIFECLKQLIKQRGIPCSIELEEASHNPAVGIKRAVVTASVKWVLLSRSSPRDGCM